MSEQQDEGAPPVTILVDFPPRPGVKDVSTSPADLVARSAASIDIAMATIKDMSNRIARTIAEIPVRPKQVEVEFGVKLDAAAGALIARAGVEAHLVVTVTWDFTPADE